MEKELFDKASQLLTDIDYLKKLKDTISNKVFVNNTQDNFDPKTVLELRTSCGANMTLPNDFLRIPIKTFVNTYIANIQSQIEELQTKFDNL